ncbi:uncharacterized protein DNG_07328 [Cephalotrichum gorgonifer]|uniref:N-acetyltransferase domain-containing protein n=1 Tax=Cephalotrichum gorgonifer TaxID=2041049 RepID=A0AAE8N411_9PEZI|nr:uncharacterized protein DNG_07328 [Cephalotrichum gorgonifer]
MSGTTVTLIPWDPESAEHSERLIEQRIACGWHADQVKGSWREAQRAGTKCIYWLEIPKEDPNYSSRMEAHLTAFPEQASNLLDTGAYVRGIERQPTNQPFNPVGHISIDTAWPGVDYLNLNTPAMGTIWIKSLYVSAPLQSAGFGRAAMDALEAMATSEPLCATTLMLDAVSKEDQMRKDFALEFYGYIPKMANEEWYCRRGYRVVKTVQDFYIHTGAAKTDWDIKTVFMRKDIA